jgi:NDP-sugar pyrophosphorylase family protein
MRGAVMRAFILAGGLGLRLKPRFGDLPKPLAPIDGAPFLARQLAWLAGHGIREAVLCLGHGADQVRTTLGEGHSHGVDLMYSIEDEPLGTGGALAHARDFVDGPALVVNGDTMPECDPWAIERDRWERGAAGAVGLFRVDDARARGRVEVTDEGHVAAFVEKDTGFTGGAWVNGGVYAFAPSLWRMLPAGVSSLERDVLPGLAERGELLGVQCPGRFFDIGTPEDWERAARELAR